MSSRTACLFWIDPWACSYSIQAGWREKAPGKLGARLGQGIVQRLVGQLTIFSVMNWG